MKLVKIVTTLTLPLLALLLLTKPTLSAVRCESQYGGNEVCVKTAELQLDKQVWNKNSSSFVDNLGLTTYKFTSEEEVIFKLKIKNVGDKKIDTVYVKDTLPNYLEHTSGDLEFEIKDLEVNQTKEHEIKAKVVKKDKLPDNQNIICVINSAEAWSGDEKDSDTAQICIEKKVLGITTTPPTGPNHWQIILSIALISSIIGLYLLKSKPEWR